MIKDSQFKSLDHYCEGYSVFSRGGEVEKGYQPDFTLKRNNAYIILESENATSRKHLLGDMIKAAHFLQGDKDGFLVIVMTPKKNTTLNQISKHLKMYFTWIQDKTNLSKVYIIDSKDYLKNDLPIPISSEDFLMKAQIV